LGTLSVIFWYPQLNANSELSSMSDFPPH
jgi:hypothetical protein